MAITAPSGHGDTAQDSAYRSPDSPLIEGLRESEGPLLFLARYRDRRRIGGGTGVRIGVDLGGTKIEAAALDGNDAIVARRRVATPADDYDATLGAIVELVEGLETDYDERGSVGAGIPGAISPETGLVKNANSTCLIGHPLDRDLSEALQRPVRVANDANCFALSEAIDGAASGAASVFGVILGTGVGGGLVIDGELLGGAQAIAGEWGHNPMPGLLEEKWTDRRCYCGRLNCIETFLSGPALAADHLR